MPEGIHNNWFFSVRIKRLPVVNENKWKRFSDHTLIWSIVLPVFHTLTSSSFFPLRSSLLSRNLVQKMDHEWTIKHSSRCYKNTRTIFQRSENLGEYVPRRWVSVNLPFTSFWITKYIWEKETVETPCKRIPDCRKNLSITSTGKRIKEWIPSILFRENPWDISVF